MVLTTTAIWLRTSLGSRQRLLHISAWHAPTEELLHKMGWFGGIPFVLVQQSQEAYGMSEAMRLQKRGEAYLRDPNCSVARNPSERADSCDGPQLLRSVRTPPSYSRSTQPFDKPFQLHVLALRNRRIRAFAVAFNQLAGHLTFQLLALLRIERETTRSNHPLCVSKLIL